MTTVRIQKWNLTALTRSIPIISWGNEFDPSTYAIYFYRKWVFAVCKLKKMNIFRTFRCFRQLRFSRQFCIS